MIYTSFYENIPNLPDNIIPISIAGKSPDNYTGLEYKKLAPKLKFWKEWEKNKDNHFYCEHYKEEVLDKLNIEEVIKDLESLLPNILFNNKNVEICLVCYEKEGFCHRNIVRNWFCSNGYECMEYEKRNLLEVGFYGSNETKKIYTNDYRNFIFENNEIVNKKELENWTICLNSPWSQIHETYKIFYNCKNAYTEIDETEPFFICEKTVIGYDGITSVLKGYGFTEEEALQNCIKNYKYLQKKYNKNNESF